MRTRYLLGMGCLLAALCSGCGGGGGDEAPPSSPPSEKVGAGWVTITSPTAQQTTTELDSIHMDGKAFISPSCVIFGCGAPNETDDAKLTGVAITWANSTTGTTGSADQSVSVCFLFLLYFLCDHRWSASIPLALGSNNIRIRAADAFGNVGTDSITIQRAPDVTPPTVTATSPSQQAQGIPVDAILSATFSESMDPASINGVTFVLFDSNNNAVPGTVTYVGNTATFDPINVLAGASTYTARITRAARDLAGNNPLASDFVWTFSTGSSLWLATSTDGAPAYSFHTAVWSGTRMIVWGNGGTGASYDPATDAWQAISSAGAPSAHLNAVWTGSEMIVWGGFQNILGLVNTAGRYRPATNIWQTISTVNAPSPRIRASVIWTGTEMIVWGGLDAATSARLNNGASYNPLTDTWRTITPTGAPSGREGHTAAWTGTEMVIWGGIDEMVTWTNTGGRFDPATDSWQATAISNAPLGRNNHSAVWTGTQMVIWGGTSGAVGNPPLNTGGRYNPATDSWQATTTVGSPSARAGYTAIWTGLEMFVWGGGDTSGPAVNTGGRYNPLTNRWSQVETSGAPTARSGHTGIWTGVSMVVWGGSGSNTGGRFIP